MTKTVALVYSSLTQTSIGSPATRTHSLTPPTTTNQREPTPRPRLLSVSTESLRFLPLAWMKAALNRNPTAHLSSLSSHQQLLRRGKFKSRCRLPKALRASPPQNTLRRPFTPALSNQLNLRQPPRLPKASHAQALNLEPRPTRLTNNPRSDLTKSPTR